MKEYKVLVTYTEGGVLRVMAKNEKEAEQIAESRMSDEGGEMLAEVDTTNREYWVIEVLKD